MQQQGDFIMETTFDITTVQAECLQNERLLHSMQTNEVVKMTRNQFIKFLGEINVYSFGTLHAISEYVPGKNGVTKKSRADKRPAEECFDFPVRKSYNVNFPFGANYGNMVQKQRDREGIEGEFVAEKPSGMTVVNRYICQGDNNPSQFYLRIPIPAPTKKFAFGESVYVDAEGKKLSFEEVKDLKENFLRLESSSDKQGTDETVGFLCVKIENVLAIAFGGKVYMLLNPETTL